MLGNPLIKSIIHTAKIDDMIYSKTTLLKCISELIPYEKGYCTLNDKSVSDYTVPIWRSKVMYVPQRPSVHPGTPLDFFQMVCKYASQKNKHIDNPVKQTS